MGVARTLTVRAITLSFVVLTVLVFTVVLLGATGLSDKILMAIVDEQTRGYKQQLSAKIHDPNQLQKAVEEYRQNLIKANGLDKPWFYRLPNMMYRIVFLDLGNSRVLQTAKGSPKIVDLIIERLPRTIILVTMAVTITFLIGLSLGVKISTIPGSITDRFTSLYAAFSYALPSWWTGILLILAFAFYLRWFPFGGLYSAPPPNGALMRFLDLLWHSILPVSELVIVSSGASIYIYRSILETTAQEDFVTTARAKGLPENLVMRRYIIRVALPPILTNVILGLAGSIGGAILTETVFQWPGMGLLYYQAIISVDERLILALTYVFTLVYAAARFILEVLYILVDPRVRY